MLINVIVCFMYIISIQKCSTANQTGKSIKHSIRQDVNRELKDSIEDLMSDYDLGVFRNQTKVKLYSKWSPWSRCTDCKQRRMKKCIQSKCKDSKIYEERSCDKKRCRRKHRKRKADFHLVLLNSDISHLTKQSHSRTWSKWSRWTTCTPDCRTYRVRYCRLPERCGSRQQQQTAYCYFDGTNCENYILNLLDQQQQYTYDNRIAVQSNNDYNRYHYQDEVSQHRRTPRKHHLNRQCGIPYKKNDMLKIIGGRESKKYKWPWHVAIINKYDEVFCGGTLISPQWVLTAAHCLRTSLKVRFSEHDLNHFDGREIEMRVRKVFQHPGFNRNTVDNDIALLMLPKTVQIPTACLPRKIPKPRKFCFVMGWGKVNPNNIYGTPILREAKLPIVHPNVCRKAYETINITPNMICAGWRSGKADTCAGDSGGGLICPLKYRKKRKIAYSVQGITSFGDGCGRHDKYGIYTTVFNYLHWIHNIMDTYT